MAVTVSKEHITLDENGVAWIEGANTKVIEVVRDVLYQHMSPDDIHDQFPDLSLSQIHAALAYYYDHKAELDEEIDRRDKKAREMQEQAGPSPLQERLRAMGRLP